MFVCLFFLFFRAARLYTYCTENSLFCRCFPEGGHTPLFGLDGNVPLSRALGRKNVMSMRELFCPDPPAGFEKMAEFQILFCY